MYYHTMYYHTITGACGSDINVFCVDVQPGASRLEDCLTQQIAEESKEGYTGNKVSAKCVKELDDFKIDRATNINKNVPLCMCLLGGESARTPPPLL